MLKNVHEIIIEKMKLGDSENTTSYSHWLEALIDEPISFQQKKFHEIRSFHWLLRQPIKCQE